MSNFEMKIIPKPKDGTATILKLSKNGKFHLIKGHGYDNYLCGACNNIICKNVERGQIVNIVFECPNCHNYNLVRGV